MSNIDISFIICTRNRPQQMLRCLASIAAATAGHPRVMAEVIVLENGSCDDLQLGEAEVVAAGGSMARLIRMQMPGLSHARNEGLRLAGGRLLVFTDDDCILDVDYVSDLLAHEATRTGDVFLGGRVKLADPTDLPFTIKDVSEHELFKQHIHPGGFVQGCNMVMSRLTSMKIGEFDTNFGAGAPMRAGEDTDYIIRAHLCGIPVEYVPDMTVFHQHGRKHLSDVRTLNYGYAFANGAIYAKYHISQPWLLKHLYWSARATCKEQIGGSKFDINLGLTWGSVLKGNILGAVQYLRLRITQDVLVRQARECDFENGLLGESGVAHDPGR